MTETVITDYHLHLRGDDLAARAADHFNAENIARYAEAAAAAGVTDLGCAEHMYRFTEALSVWRHPFWDEWAIDDIDQYVEAVESSPIKLGIEGDYILGAEEKLEAMLGSRPFDYVVGSVHFLGDYSLDTEEYTIWDGTQDADDIWRRYFETLASAARSGLFDILAHPDLVKVWGRAGRSPSVDPRTMYEPAIEAIADTGIAVEVSTAGLRKGVGEIYPAPAFMEMCVEAGAVFALSSDAHEPDQIGFRYPEALEFLASHGVEQLAIFEDRQRKLVPVGELKASEGATGEVG
ncbi:MAG: histidinol-phosphatase HisJ family protein [Solirubrobacterales bacterium]|nr:histidinol-phosphatase HisJ family protein [Solirubrobacterales bacterium]OJU93640.1 MAG: histidinol phosphate phosphatase [Solirubrobacterales bacterium 67-14]